MHNTPAVQTSATSLQFFIYVIICADRSAMTCIQKKHVTRDRDPPCTPKSQPFNRFDLSIAIVVGKVHVHHLAQKTAVEP